MLNTESYFICSLKFPVYTETSAVPYYSIHINTSAMPFGEHFYTSICAE